MTTTPEASATTGTPPPDSGLRPDRTTIAVCAGIAVVAGVAGVFVGVLATLAVAGLALAALAAVRPVTAPYLYMATLPFLAGIDRGTLIPLVRPNEALLTLLVAGAATGGYLRYLRGDPVRLRIRPLDGPLAAFVVAMTLWPLVSLMLRGHAPAPDELAALLPIVKLTGILLLVRLTLTTPDRQRRMLRIVLWTAAGVAVVAILQTAGFPPVLHLLGSLWTTIDSPDDINERGTTMFASSIATGDYIVLSLAILAGMAVRGAVSRRELVVLGPLLAAGVLAAGQFSTWAAIAVVLVVLLRQYPALRRMARRFLPVVAVAAVVGAPAAITRLSEFGGQFGVPRSWLGRWDNLTNFYLPAFDPEHVLLGISPNSVLQAPETWREQIYLEFGYLQLLWIGGIPLLVAFGWLSWAVLERCRALRYDPAPIGVAATALRAGWWMVLVLSLIDIHLTLRGTGDLLFVLLGIVGGRADAREP